MNGDEDRRWKSRRKHADQLLQCLDSARRCPDGDDVAMPHFAFVEWRLRLTQIHAQLGREPAARRVLSGKLSLGLLVRVFELQVGLLELFILSTELFLRDGRAPRT